MPRRVVTAAVLAALVAGVGCSDDAPLAVPTPASPATTAATPPSGKATPAPAPTPKPTPTPAATRRRPAAASFAASTSRITAATRARMSKSWRPGCPVPLEQLRLIRATHWGYDGRVRTGELVVHRDVAADVVTVLRRLFAARFPIERMRLVDEYGADDRTSMRANNTSALNCRYVEDRPGVWSQHAFGRAIDVNPLVNPYVDGAEIDPPEGARYADRSTRAPGLIRSGDVAVRAFAAEGWEWGGYWRNSKDYQHFSSNGR
ncbi:MAG TPA: M15 family metallopeptidase [Mycobacteriales bacterium]|nr:M15 family metallopeptidase [Mycobacteriales bacterium]